MSSVRPFSIVVGPDGHGVVRHALTVAQATRARVARYRRPPAGGRTRPPVTTAGDVVHLHFTDRLFGRHVDEAADTFVALTGRLRVPLVVTLHDVPGGGDDDRSVRRRRAYRRVAGATDAVIVTADHERARLTALGADREVHVVPFPLVARPGADATPAPRRGRPRLAVLGFVYPGKGHDVAIDVAGRLGGLDVVALGDVSPGHGALAAELRRRAGATGCSFAVTGHLSDRQLDRQLGTIDVPLALYPDVSASLSIVTWIAAGRRPLVAPGPYVDELVGRAPGCVRIVDPHDVDALDRAVRDALADPATTRSTDRPAGLSLAEVGRRHQLVYEELACRH